MDVMQVILEIEKKAQASLQEAESFEQEQSRDLDAELAKLDALAQEEVNLALEQTAKRCQEEQKEALDKAEKEMREQLEQLERVYAEHRTDWVAQMTKNIIG